MRQVIAFIAPDTFYTLLAGDAVRTGFTVRRGGRNIHLNDDEHVFYVNSDQMWSGIFNETDAKDSVYILIPDDLDIEYMPDCEFAVLYHTQTPTERVEWLSGSGNFRGAQEFPEDTHTIYNTIAQQIIKGAIDVEPVWEVLTGEYIMAAKDSILKQIGRGDDLKMITTPNCLSKYSADFEKLKSTILDRFDGANPCHQEALAYFKRQLLDS